MASALVFGLDVIIFNGVLFIGVDVNSEFGGCADFAFEAADFGVELLVGVGNLLEEDALCVDLEGWMSGRVRLKVYMCVVTITQHKESG